MIVFLASLSVIIFIIALWAFRIVPLCVKAISISQDAISTIRNDNYNDIEREKAVQQASIMLLKIFFSIFYRTILILITCLLPILLADWLGWAKTEDVAAFLSRLDVILIFTILLLIIFFAGKKLWLSK